MIIKKNPFPTFSYTVSDSKENISFILYYIKNGTILIISKKH